MKRIIKIFAGVLFLLVVAFFVFFFWASSSTLDASAYASIEQDDIPTEVSKDSIVSIVTYNIGYLSGMTNNLPVAKPKSLFDKNLNKVLQEVKKINPDLIAFQEIDFNANRSYAVDQNDAIANLGFSYRAKAINWDKRYLPFPYWPISTHFGKVVSGQSIISKYPILDQQRIVLQRVADTDVFRNAFYLDRLAQIVTVDINGKEVILVNVHLEAFDAPTRQKQMKEVVQLLDSYKNQPLILLGDFNSEARDPNSAIQELIQHPDFGNAAFDSSNPANTFDAVTPVRRIDYIFYTKSHIQEVSSRVLTEFGDASDHLPVQLSFQLK